jgi:hypothetical protein
MYSLAVIIFVVSENAFQNVPIGSNVNLHSMSCGGGHLGFPFGIKNRNFVEGLLMIIHGQFGFNCPSGFREEAF